MAKLKAYQEAAQTYETAAKAQAEYNKANSTAEQQNKALYDLFVAAGLARNFWYPAYKDSDNGKTIIEAFNDHKPVTLRVNAPTAKAFQAAGIHAGSCDVVDEYIVHVEFKDDGHYETLVRLLARLATDKAQADAYAKLNEALNKVKAQIAKDMKEQIGNVERNTARAFPEIDFALHSESMPKALLEQVDKAFAPVQTKSRG